MKTLAICKALSPVWLQELLEVQRLKELEERHRREEEERRRREEEEARGDETHLKVSKRRLISYLYIDHFTRRCILISEVKYWTAGLYKHAIMCQNLDRIVVQFWHIMACLLGQF